MNRIIEVKLTMMSYAWVDDAWMVTVTKAFAPENGGGIQVFTQAGGPNVHEALCVAKDMVTVTPARRTDL